MHGIAILLPSGNCVRDFAMFCQVTRGFKKSCHTTRSEILWKHIDMKQNNPNITHIIFAGTMVHCIIVCTSF